MTTVPSILLYPISEVSTSWPGHFVESFLLTAFLVCNANRYADKLGEKQDYGSVARTPDDAPNTKPNPRTVWYQKCSFSQQTADLQAFGITIYHT